MLRIRQKATERIIDPQPKGWDLLFWLLGLCLLCYLLVPLLSFFGFLPWQQVPATLSDPNAIDALLTSVTSATISTSCIGLFGIPLAYILARFAFPGKGLISLIIYLPLVFPPVVSGILLILLYGPYGPIGEPFINMGWEFDDSLAGIVIAQIFVSAPFLVVSARRAFESIDPTLEKVGMTLGQSRWGVFWKVSLPLASHAILVGLILAWVRALGEFGATIVMAYHPYTLPVYVYVQLSGSGVPGALPLALLSLGVSIIVIGLVLLIERHSQHLWQALSGRSNTAERKQ